MKRLAAALLIAALVGCRRAPEVPTATARRGEFHRTVLADGYLRAAASTPLNAPQEAQGPLRVNSLIADGTLVAQGDVVARFDDTPWTKQLTDAHGKRETADLKRMKHDVSARTSAETSALEAELARGELRQAEGFRATDEELFSRHERLESELDAELARQRERHALDVQGVRLRVQQGEGELLSIERRKADLEVDRARRALGALELRAPHDGLLILVRNWRGNSIRPGDTVWPSQPVAEIPRLEVMEAEVFVLEADAGGLSAGQSALVTLESRPEVAFAAQVKRVDKVARPRARGVPVQYFGATLALAATDAAIMKPGQRVRVRIDAETLADVVVVARQAVFEREGRRVVYRRRDRAFEEQAVEIATSSGGEVVISAGVAAGDVLALIAPGESAPQPAAGVTTAKGGGS